MEVNTYTGHEIIKKPFDFIASFQDMKKYENARKVLPKDTSYALVAEIVAREIGESFAETDVITTLGVPTSVRTSFDGGLRGRFVGYLSIGSDKLRIHTQDGQLVFEEVLNKLQTDMVKTNHMVGDYCIQNATKKFAIGQLAIIDANPDFKSEITPFAQGIQPLFDLMAEGGAAIKVMSKEEQRAYYRWGFKVFFVVVGIMIIIPVVIVVILILSGH